MARARKMDGRAMEQVLSESYPAVCRVAHALAGKRTASRVVRLVLRRGLRVLPTWRKGVLPENWFYHHTLLTARELASHPISADQDELLSSGPAEDPAYAAFVRALRALPRQQMEAFVLNHGESLNTRLLGVAMDCSTQAAATHLAAATQTLGAIAHDRFTDLTASLSRAYTALTPTQTALGATVHREVSSTLWSIRLRRLLRRLIFLALLAGLVWVSWHWRHQLVQLLQNIRSRATTRPG